MLSLQDREWQRFRIGDIFSINAGKRLTKQDMIEGNKPFIGASDSNNGVTAFVGNTNGSEDSNVLGVNYDGSVVENFYHPYVCLFSDSVKRFHTKNVLGNKYIYLFLKKIILQQKKKYTYGHKFNERRMRKQFLLLPVDKNGEPDYVFMEQYVREREGRILQNCAAHFRKNAQPWEGTLPPLSEKKWEPFFIEDIAEILSGQDIYDAERTPGNIPYVSSSSVNNGICHFVGNVNETLEAGCVSVNRNGSVGYAFYHPYKALYSNDCRKLRLKAPNKYAALFIAAQITAQRDKYSYGYKMGTGRLKRQKIILPVDENGAPDWAYMEAYVRQQVSAILMLAHGRGYLFEGSDDIVATE